MSLNTVLTTTGRTAVIALQGSMNGEGDLEFLDKVERATAFDLAELVLDMSALENLTTAGLRTLTYARQRMGDDVDLVISAPSDRVKEVLKNADFDDAVSFRE